MEQRSPRRVVPLLVAFAQLALAAFLVIRFLGESERVTAMVLLVSMLVTSSLLFLLNRWWALSTGVVVNSLLVAVLWLGALDRQTSDAFLGATVLSLPWLVGLVHWVRERARRKSENAAREAAETAARAEQGLPPMEVPEGWTKEWGGGRVKFGFMLFFGLLCVAAGIGVGAGEDVASGVGLVSFGVALLCAAPLFRAWDRDGEITSQPIAERGGEMGLVFPYSTHKTLAAVGGAVAMGIACASFAFGGFKEGPKTETEWTVFGIVGAVFFGGMALLQLRRNGIRGGYLALLEGGIYATIGSAKSFVPWDAISDVGDVEMKMYVRGAAVHEPFIGLMLSHPERVEMSWVARKMMRANRWLAADITYPVRSLDVDPRTTLQTIRYYLDNPDDRAELRHVGAKIPVLPAAPEEPAIQAESGPAGQP